jgi:hypothetical protein
MITPVEQLGVEKQELRKILPKIIHVASRRQLSETQEHTSVCDWDSRRQPTQKQLEG